MSNDAPLSIERKDGSIPGTRILALTGPLTLRNIFELQTELRGGEVPKLSILDLSGVPYMDSAGMGLIINHFVHCQNCGGKMVVAGVSPRVNELFRMTRVDSVIPQAASVEAAEAAG
jgi:anti-sigma B factor antagonist